MKCKFGMAALCGLLSAGAAFGAQYVANPEFETLDANGVAPGWERAGDTFSVRKGEGYNGTIGLVYENDDPKRYRFPFQNIGLKPGHRYLVTAMIRTENIQGKDIGAGVCVEFTSGGSYSKGFKGTTEGWVKVAFTSDVPARATAESIVVSPFVRRGCTGRAWFDDIHITDLERPPVETLASSAYRDCATDGTVAFVAVLNLEDTEGWKGSFTVRTARGSRTLKPEKFTADCAAIRLPVADLPVGVSEIRFRLADARGKTVAEKTLRFERLAKGTDRRRVRFDAHGRTLVDGKPFFPLGIYIDPRDASCIDTIAKSPFNCVLPGEAPEKPALYDACQKQGLMVVGNVGRYYADIGRESVYASMADAERQLTAWIEAYRSHPAILAWYVADEIPSHLAGVLENRKKLIGRLDPDHPTYAVTCHPEELRYMLSAYEVSGSDPYPIRFDGRDKKIAEAARWARMTRKGLYGIRPIWQVPQIFDWIAHRRESKSTRAPTYEEMRSMVWQAIAEGANGIFCYAFMSVKWAAELGHDPFDKRWREICEVADEVKSRTEGLLSNECPPKLGPLPEGLSARGWTLNGVKTVVLVNQNVTPLAGTLLVDGVEMAFDLKPLEVAFRNVNAPIRPAAGSAGLTIDANVPAGNVVVRGIEGDTVRLLPDLRDTRSAWFYWAFRVKGAKGRKLDFVFDKDWFWGMSVGVRGPAVTTDGGRTWSYPCDGKATPNSFSHAFADDGEVWFYETWQYLPDAWTAFLDAHEKDRGRKFETDVLCRSGRGADVPCARFGCIGRTPKCRVFLSSRHHCSEAPATAVVEGLAAAFLGEDDLARWLCGNVELMVVPFVDCDGVIAGDQGKNRRPHDHARDYREFFYPETKAIAAWIASHAAGRLDAFIDVHCPGIRDSAKAKRKTNEVVYTPWKDPKTVPDAAGERRFSELLETCQAGGMRYRASDDLPFGEMWNTGGNYSQGWSAVQWACRNVKGLKVARCLEVPFANANGAIVTPESCRGLGRDLACALAALFKERGEK